MFRFRIRPWGSNFSPRSVGDNSFRPSLYLLYLVPAGTSTCFFLPGHCQTGKSQFLSFGTYFLIYLPVVSCLGDADDCAPSPLSVRAAAQIDALVL